MGGVRINHTCLEVPTQGGLGMCESGPWDLQTVHVSAPSKIPTETGKEQKRGLGVDSSESG